MPASSSAFQISVVVILSVAKDPDKFRSAEAARTFLPQMHFGF